MPLVPALFNRIASSSRHFNDRLHGLVPREGLWQAVNVIVCLVVTSCHQCAENNSVSA